MIVGVGKNLETVRTILSNKVNDIFVCKNIADKYDTDYYTLIRVYDDNIIKEILEIIYDRDGNCKLPKDFFRDLFVEVDTLNIVMRYFEPRKLFIYLKSYMNTDYAQHMIIKNLVYKCLSLDVSFPILYLMLDKDNINLDEDLNVFFNGFLDFSNFDKDADEEKCVRRCCDLIEDILMANEELTRKSQVKSVNLFVKKKRNKNYKKMIDLFNDFKIKENKYKKDRSSIMDYVKSSLSHMLKYNLKNIVLFTGLILIAFAVIVFICNLFRLDLPFTSYKGLNTIGTVNMGER